MSLAFVDTETTGLDPDRHEIWEIGLIVDGETFEWQLSVNLQYADPGALRVGRFYERRDVDHPNASDADVAGAVARLTANCHLVGANPAFDAAFLSRFLHRFGFKDAWHYHLIDVETLMLGYLWRKVHENREAGYTDSIEPPLPWKSTDLSLAIGVDPDDFDRHTALGDAQWVKAIYEAIT